jgi:hypothetical protein
MQRIDALAKISEDSNCLTRTFCSPAMRRANALVATWMREAGMAVHTDAIGNIIGHYPAAILNSKIKNHRSKIFLLGSHLFTIAKFACPSPSKSSVLPTKKASVTRAPISEAKFSLALSIREI